MVTRAQEIPARLRQAIRLSGQNFPIRGYLADHEAFIVRKTQEIS